MQRRVLLPQTHHSVTGRLAFEDEPDHLINELAGFCVRHQTCRPRAVKEVIEPINPLRPPLLRQRKIVRQHHGRTFLRNGDRSRRTGPLCLSLRNSNIKSLIRIDGHLSNA